MIEVRLYGPDGSRPYRGYESVTVSPQTFCGVGVRDGDLVLANRTLIVFPTSTGRKARVVTHVSIGAGRKMPLVRPLVIEKRTRPQFPPGAIEVQVAL
jgi:hypothetical protein